MQVPPPDLVWVVEDGLVGDSFAWDKGGPVRITRWKENRGYLAARMMMMTETEADIYVSLDDDAWFLDSGSMNDAVQVMAHNPSVAAVAFEILSPDRQVPVGKRGIMEARVFIGCGHALRLSAVREVGGYEKMPGLYGFEEKDLCLKLMDRGWKIVELLGARIWHDKTTVLRDLKKQKISGSLNSLTMIARRCPAAQLPWNLAGSVIHQFLFACRKPNESLVPLMCGLVSFAYNLPFVMATRRPVKPGTWRRYRSLA